MELLARTIDVGTAVVIGVVIVVLLFALLRLLKSFLHVCPPNEVLIFSGGRGGYRTVLGGRGFRRPFIETVQKMSLNTMEVPIAVRNAYSRGGIPLNVDAVANVKISSSPKVLGNAIERFLGRDMMEVRRVAKETLEGHLRGVLARLTPEEVNEDRLRFAEELSVESELDLNKLGIHLDTLKIQHVSDEKRYLDSIGREAIANVIKAAEMAESDAKRQAELIEAENQARAKVMKANVDANIARMRNDLRRIQADLEAEVRSEEERTLAAAREARARAEQELQRVRTELETIRLEADQILPADANRRAQEYRAKGEAAILRERGVAASQALELMNQAWADAGDAALSIYLIEDIEKILATAAKGVDKIKVGSLQMIDGGDGKTLAGYAAAYPSMLGTIFDAVQRTTGIDIPKAVGGPIGDRSPNGQTPEGDAAKEANK
jgi:flotillin